MSSSSIWVPISSAVAALFGAGFGAMLQGRYGTAGWRRQIRLEAYTEFLAAAHDFDDLLTETLRTIEESNFDEKRRRLEESRSRLRHRAEPVRIAGPESVDSAMESLLRAAFRINQDLKNGDTFISTAHAWRKNKSYDNWENWIQAAERFTPIARTILKTE